MGNKRKQAKKAGYDSMLEMALAEGPFKDFVYHPDPVSYTVPESEHKYTPDFQNGKVLIETKGRFRTRAEMDKYKHIYDSLLKEGKELVFVFENPDLPLPGAKKRKDGTKRSHKEYAESLGIRSFGLDEVDKLTKKK